MTHLEILDKAKHIVFPVHDLNKKTIFPNYPIDNLILSKFQNAAIHHLFVENDTYDGIPYNHHHFATGYHRKHVIPVIFDLLGMKFDIVEYDMMPWFVHYNGADDPTKNYDFTYLKFKKDTKFYIYDHTLGKGKTLNSLSRDWNDKDLINFEHTMTDYHNLFYCCHSCATITNLNLKNGPTLLISCDSQMIPSIPVLANHFSKITVLDLRQDIDIRSAYENNYFDFVLICYWSDIKYYAADFNKKVFTNFYLEPYF